jgi:hypothetical protein
VYKHVDDDASAGESMQIDEKRCVSIKEGTHNLLTGLALPGWKAQRFEHKALMLMLVG